MVLEFVLHKNKKYGFRPFGRFFCLLALILLVIFCTSNEAFAAKSKRVSARDGLKDRYASIVIDANSGDILSQENADKRLYPASLTKMMTLYLTFDAMEKGKLHKNSYLTVSKKATRQPPSNIGFRHSDSIRVENAILALVTKSANDVAVVLAETLAGSEEEFAFKMNRKARELGMNRTNFANASGLFNKNQYSTARDMAVLGASLIKDFPQYYHYFSTPEFTYRGVTYGNHNKLMKTYQGMDGLKTGYIYASGFNLAASAKRNGVRLVGVVFGGRTGSSRNKMMAKLLDKGFDSYNKGNNSLLASVSSNPSRNFFQPTPAKRPQQYASATSIRDLYSKYGVFEQGDAGLEEDSNETSKKWSVQVGSFKNKQSGLKAIKEIKSSIGTLIEANDVVAPLVTSRGTIYRARITGITLGDARSACNLLQGKCLILTAD